MIGAKKARGVTQILKHLPHKHEALSSIPSTTTTSKKECIELGMCLGIFFST
jgi:hypothetical protein